MKLHLQYVMLEAALITALFSVVWIQFGKLNINKVYSTLKELWYTFIDNRSLHLNKVNI